MVLPGIPFLKLARVGRRGEASPLVHFPFYALSGSFLSSVVACVLVIARAFTLGAFVALNSSVALALSAIALVRDRKKTPKGSAASAGLDPVATPVDAKLAGPGKSSERKRGLLLDAWIPLVVVACFLAVGALILAQFKYPVQYDSYVFVARVYDLLEYRPDVVAHVDYYFGSVFYLLYYVYFLLPFFAPGVLPDAQVLTFVVPAFQSLILLGLLCSTFYRAYGKTPLLGLLMVPTGLFLPTWMMHPIASSLAIPIFFGTLLVYFHPDFYSPTLLVTLLAFLALIHSASLFLLLVLFAFYQVADFLFDRKGRLEKRERITESLKFHSRVPLIVWMVVVAGTVTVLIYAFVIRGFEAEISNFLNYLFTAYEESQDVRYNTPGILVWTQYTPGFLAMFTCAFFVFFTRRSTYKLPRDSLPLSKTFYVGFAMFTLIPLFIRAWFNLTHIPWMYYRYFIYMDYFVWICFPLTLLSAYQGIKSWYARRRPSLPRGRLERDHKLLAAGFLCLFAWNVVSVSSSDSRWGSTLDAGGVKRVYFVNNFYRHVPDDFLDLCSWLAANTTPNDLVFVQPQPHGAPSSYLYYATLYKLLLVDIDQARQWTDAWVNRSSDQQFLLEFREFLLNGTKKLQQYGRTFSEGLVETNAPVTYVLLDDYSDIYVYNYSTTLLELLERSPGFQLIEKRNYYYWIYRNWINFSLFRVI